MVELKEQKPQFSALLTPHRALGQKGVNNVIIITCILAAIPGLVFFLMGAWPIVGFLGLDVALLYWALNHSRQDVNGFEEVVLFPDQLCVRQVSPKGSEKHHQLNPFWTKLEVVRDFEDQVVEIILRSKNQNLKIGTFLNPDDKRTFAHALSNALFHLKR